MSQIKSALLLMDFMPIVVPAFGGDDNVLARANEASARAREKGVPVIHVRVRFRPGYPEVDASNRIFGPLSEAFDFTEANPATGVHELVDVEASDILVTKRRVSAFAGSDLQELLRGFGVREIALSGVATSGVVLSTLRQAADLDYRIVVLEDACADDDPEVHSVLTEKVFPRQAEVTSTANWISALG
ncbi:cysteine hydrolase family protein [Diaminobutyricimonas sp. LJ205]|uniref:cysteine hydrolase family protein n=1 Tax=Diaminobutyricimonas sp. LJ205 TaxID=2683590 RepID=UPI0012F515BF|nr:cysteine hydrolase [Diaminobutyricimonas sp. LJ205]